MYHIEQPDNTGEVVSLDFIWMELTNQCNLQCVHCYSESSPKSFTRDLLTVNDYKRLIIEAHDIGCKTIQFVGGEPTLNKELPKLIEHASSIGYTVIEVFTNLVTLNISLLDVLKKHRVSVATSFYSNDPSVHDAITQTAGSFVRTTKNIQRIIDAGLNLRVGVISMRENAESIESTLAYLRNLGVTAIGLDNVRAVGRAKQHSVCGMEKLCGNCAGNVLAVGPDGIVAPCIMSKQWAVGSVFDAPLSQLANSDNLLNVRRQIAVATTKASNASCHTDSVPLDSSCQPNCTPMVQCLPCAPNGGHKCLPNNNCNPGLP